MKDVFLASFFHQGLLGGALFLQADKVVYRTNKLQIDPAYRNLAMPYAALASVQPGHFLCFPTLTFIMKDGLSYRFLVFRQKACLSRLAAWQTAASPQMPVEDS